MEYDDNMYSVDEKLLSEIKEAMHNKIMSLIVRAKNKDFRCVSWRNPPEEPPNTSGALVLK